MRPTPTQPLHPPLHRGPQAPGQVRPRPHSANMRPPLRLPTHLRQPGPSAYHVPALPPSPRLTKALENAPGTIRAHAEPPAHTIVRAKTSAMKGGTRKKPRSAPRPLTTSRIYNYSLVVVIVWKTRPKHDRRAKKSQARLIMVNMLSSMLRPPRQVTLTLKARHDDLCKTLSKTLCITVQNLPQNNP